MNRRDAFRAGAAFVLGAPIAAEAVVNSAANCNCAVGADICSGFDGIISFSVVGDPNCFEPSCAVMSIEGFMAEFTKRELECWDECAAKLWGVQI